MHGISTTSLYFSQRVVSTFEFRAGDGISSRPSMTKGKFFTIKKDCLNISSILYRLYFHLSYHCCMHRDFGYLHVRRHRFIASDVDAGPPVIKCFHNYHVCSTRLPYVFMVTIPFGSSVCASMQLFYSRCLTLLNGRFFIRAPPPAHPYGFVGFAHIVYLHYIYAWHIYHIPIFLPASRQHI